MIQNRMLPGILCLIGMCWIVSASGQENRSPTVGVAGWIDQLVLPGSELATVPLVEGIPIVVRIREVFPHGDSFRYDLVFQGMEPGKYNLADYLRRKDGSPVGQLPEIPVEIRSLLPPGQIEPNALETGLLPRMGGYRVVMIAAIGIWSLVFLGLIFLGRKKMVQIEQEEKALTLADLLKARIEHALENPQDQSQYAELERMLTAFWTKRLGLEEVSTHEAIVAIKSDAKAGPLMQQLELWMHSPNADRSVDLDQLVKPFQKLPADTEGFEL
ncbi:MAG: hypothetical protein AAF623_12070 [Planctomycetota bacterium]